MREGQELAPPARLPRFYRFRWGLLYWLLVALAVVATPFAWSYGVGFLWTVAGWLVVGAGLAFLSQPVAEEKERLLQEVQWDRDRFAEELLEKLRSGQPVPPFSLYLRPFFTDNEIIEPQHGFLRYLGPLGRVLASVLESSEKELEHEIAETVIGFAPLVALGIRYEGMGAGRIVTDDSEWRAVLADLLEAATFIWMVPIGQPATLDEIKTIVSRPELLEKTIFVQPSNLKRTYFAFGPEGQIKSVAKMWEWTREALADVVQSFPPYSYSSRLFQIGADGTIKAFHGNGNYSINQSPGIRSLFRRHRWFGRLTSILLTTILIALIGRAPVADENSYFYMLIIIIIFGLGFVIWGIVRRKIPARLFRLYIVSVVAINVVAYPVSIIAEFYYSGVVDPWQPYQPGWLQYYVQTPLLVVASAMAMIIVYDLVSTISNNISTKRRIVIVALMAAFIECAFLVVLRSIYFNYGPSLPEWMGALLGAVPLALAIGLGAARARWALPFAIALLIAVFSNEVVNNFVFRWQTSPNELERGFTTWLVALACQPADYNCSSYVFEVVDRYWLAIYWLWGLAASVCRYALPLILFGLAWWPRHILDTRLYLERPQRRAALTRA